jgi:hypothetical protein
MCRSVSPTYLFSSSGPLMLRKLLPSGLFLLRGLRGDRLGDQRLSAAGQAVQQIGGSSSSESPGACSSSLMLMMGRFSVISRSRLDFEEVGSLGYLETRSRPSALMPTQKDGPGTGRCRPTAWRAPHQVIPVRAVRGALVGVVLAQLERASAGHPRQGYIRTAGDGNPAVLARIATGRSVVAQAPNPVAVAYFLAAMAWSTVW